MACEANVTKGRQLIFLIRNDADTLWEVAGGVKTRGFTFDNPVEDVTSSSTVGEYQDSEWTGFSQANINISGVADKRTGITDPNGYNIVGSSRVLEVATTGNRCGKVRMLNVDTNGYIEGFFNFTNFSKTGDTPGLLSYDSTLQSKSDVTVVGEV
jgi:predicted secreted protein